MNLRERLQLRAAINLILSVIERLVSIFTTVKKNFGPKPKVDTPDSPVKPNRPRPLKRVVDTIDNIIPVPWRDKK